MEFRTTVDIPKAPFQIEPTDKLLFVGSCFADSIGRRFEEEHFHVTVNPFGTMYNPASVLHTIERTDCCPDVAFITLGTNHIYRLRETGEIVDNCQKRPQVLFTEEKLSIDNCVEFLSKAVEELQKRSALVKVVATVSPIRYAKYGYHESQLSKATLLLAIEKLHERYPDRVTYFPAYELLLDELRDYRFFQPDMLHPSAQAVDFIFERLAQSFLSQHSLQFIREWQPIKKALNHKPFNPDSKEYLDFIAEAKLKEKQLMQKYNTSDTVVRHID